MTRTPIWLDFTCDICGRPFDDELDWVNRHTGSGGVGELHDTCCEREGPCAVSHDDLH